MAKIQVSPRSFLLPLLGILAAACSSSENDDRPQVLVGLQLGDGVPAPQKVDVSAEQGSAIVKTYTIPWDTGSTPKQVRLVFPIDVSGPVTISALAITCASVLAQGRIAEPVVLAKGEIVGPFALIMNAIPNPGEDGGIKDSGADRGESETGAEVGDGAPKPSDAETDAGVADAALDTVNVPDVPSGDDDARDAPANDAPDGAAMTPDATDDGPHTMAWELATNVQSDRKTCSGHVVAVDPINEHVYAAWLDDTTVKVRRWNRQTATWEKTVTLENRGTPNTPAIGVDVDGKAMVLWPQNTGGVNTSLDGVWMSQSADGTTWSPAVRIAAGGSYDLKLAMARNGTGHAAYAKKSLTDEGFWALYTAYFDGTVWTENSKPVEPKTYTSSDFEPQLAVGALGDGLLVYYQGWDLAGTALTGTSFTAPIILNPNHASVSAYSPALTINRKGEGVLVWTESTGNSTALLARGYSPALSWGTPTPPIVIEDAIGTPAVALDEQGTITLAWQQYITSGGYDLVGMRGKLEGPWSDVTLLETDNLAGSSTTKYNEADPKMALDANGNVMVVWRKDLSEGKTATIGAYAARYAAGAWSPQAKIGLKTGLDIPYVGLAVTDSGMAAVVFRYIDLNSTTTDPDSYQATVALFR